MGKSQAIPRETSTRPSALYRIGEEALRRPESLPVLDAPSKSQAVNRQACERESRQQEGPRQRCLPSATAAKHEAHRTQNCRPTQRAHAKPEYSGEGSRQAGAVKARCTWINVVADNDPSLTVTWGRAPTRSDASSPDILWTNGGTGRSTNKWWGHNELSRRGIQPAPPFGEHQARRCKEP